MVQSIELLFDDDTERALRAAWSALADAGLPSLAAHTGGSNRPHVTVAVAERGLDTAVAALRPVFEGWGLAADGVAVTVGAPVLFGGSRRRFVLARQIVPSRPLLTLHSAVHRALEQHAPEAQVLPHTAPDAWTPHVTLAGRLPGPDLGDALAALALDPLPGRIRGARLWDSAARTVTPLARVP